MERVKGPEHPGPTVALSARAPAATSGYPGTPSGASGVGVADVGRVKV